MAKPIVSVVGNLGNYQSVNPVLSKILWSGGAFNAPAAEQLTSGNGMPISAAGNAPAVFSFLNEAADDPTFRVALTNYTYTAGNLGSSQFWFYDPTGLGWALKGNGNPWSFNPPFNPYALANVVYGVAPYLVVADYDSAGSAGGTLCLLSMNASDAYARVNSATLTLPNKTVGSYTYQAHVEDVYVVDSDNIYVLVIYSVVNSTTPPPPSLTYIESEVRKYQLTGSGSSIAFNQVGTTVVIDKNAVGLVPYPATNPKQLFIPCIGGMQNYGGNNGASSSLTMIDVSGTSMSGGKQAYIGGAYPALHDFRSLAIASDGTAYILTGDYDANYNMQWILYQTTATNLYNLAVAGNPGTIPSTLQVPNANGTHYNAYFWALGICSNGSAEYLVFGKGSSTASTAVAQDEVRFLQVGAAWGTSTAVSPDDLNGTAAASAGFAINSLDVSVPGGTVRLKSAPAPAQAASAATEEEDETTA